MQGRTLLLLIEDNYVAANIINIYIYMLYNEIVVSIINKKLMVYFADFNLSIS